MVSDRSNGNSLSRSCSDATVSLIDRKRRIVCFMPSIVDASLSTSRIDDWTLTGLEKSKRRIASASAASARTGREIVCATRGVTGTARSSRMTVIAMERLR